MSTHILTYHDLLVCLTNQTYQAPLTIIFHVPQPFLLGTHSWCWNPSSQLWPFQEKMIGGAYGICGPFFMPILREMPPKYGPNMLLTYRHFRILNLPLIISCRYIYIYLNMYIYIYISYIFLINDRLFPFCNPSLLKFTLALYFTIIRFSNLKSVVLCFHWFTIICP